jgi:hypothetical protein
MSYDIEGWENNEGSGDSGWLNDVMNTGDNVANYVPEGYSNPTWDTSEHYSYEPGTNYGDDSSTSDDSSYSSNYGGSSGSSGLVGSQGSGTRSSSGGSSSSGSGTRNSGNNGNSNSWLNGVVTSVVSSTKTPTKAMPTYGDLPEVPTYNESKVRGLQQKYAAPGINKLRSAVSSALTQSNSLDNPYLRKTLVKSALEGFGSGLGNVMTSADTTARSAYDTEYKGNLLGYNTEVSRQNTIFQAAMEDYLNTMNTTQTSTQTSSRTGGTSSY